MSGRPKITTCNIRQFKIDEKLWCYKVKRNRTESKPSCQKHYNTWRSVYQMTIGLSLLFKCWVLSLYMLQFWARYTLLQMRSTPSEQGFLIPATLLFNHLIHDIIQILYRSPINTNNNDDHYETFVEIQSKADRNHDRSIRSTVLVQREDGWPWNKSRKVGPKPQ